MYLIFCIDKPGSLDIRKANRDAHLAYLKEQGDKLVSAGPTIAEDGETMNGSLLLMNFADKAEADAFAANDPYAKAGLFESVTIRKWKKVLGD